MLKSNLDFTCKVHQYEYNDNNKVIKARYFRNFNELLCEEEYFYDEKGNNTIVRRSHDVTPVIKDFDDNGNCIRLNDDGFEIQYKYDDKNRLIQEIIGNSITEYSYNDNNRVISMKNSLLEHTYEYDEDGNNLLCIIDNTTGYKISVKNEYNDKNILIKSTRKYKSHTSVMEYKYDDKDRCIEMIYRSF